MNNPPKRNQLVIPSLVLACGAVLAIPFTMTPTSMQLYFFLTLPFGLVAALMAKIALNQIKRGFGTIQDQIFAIAAYFLGLFPALLLCGMFTYDLYG